jgi:hypothetical protein
MEKERAEVRARVHLRARWILRATVAGKKSHGGLD